MLQTVVNCFQFEFFYGEKEHCIRIYKQCGVLFCVGGAFLACCSSCHSVKLQHWPVMGHTKSDTTALVNAYCNICSVCSYQTWVTVRSQEEGRLWSFAVISLNDVPSLTIYRPLTTVLCLTQPETCSGLLLMVLFSQTLAWTKYLKAYCQDWRLLDLMLASNPNTLFLKNTLFKCLSLQFYQRVFACSLTVAWRCSLGLPQSSPTSWSSTLGYWRSPKK